MSACRLASAAATIAAALGLLSCGPAAPPGPKPDSIRLVDGAAYRETIASLRGQVVLVDFWATWCAPCRKQFPHTVELSRRFADDGLAVVSVSLDDPAERESVAAFLAAQRADFTHLISRFGTGSRSVEEFGLRGDVPFYRLYDRAGALRYQFSADPEGLANGEPLEMMDRRVEKLLAEGR